jgi:hypothetical protein
MSKTAASILRDAQPEISRLRDLRINERRAWLEANGSRLTADKEARKARLIVVREACAHINQCGGEVALMYQSNDIRPIVERRGLRVRMVNGLAVIYKGV